MRLSRTDIEVLLEALVAWENKDATGDMLTLMLGGFIEKNLPPEEQQKMRRSAEERERKSKLDRLERVETSVRIRARLLDMRDAMMSDS